MGRMRGAGTGRACGTGEIPAARNAPGETAGPETRPETPRPSVSRFPKSRRVAPRRTYAYSFASLASPRMPKLVYPRGVGAFRGKPGVRRERAAAAAATRAVRAAFARGGSGDSVAGAEKGTLGARATAAGAGTPGATSTIAPLGISFFVGFMSELDAGATEPVRYRGSVNPEVYRVRRSLYSAGDGPTRVPVELNRSMPLRNALCDPPWRSLCNGDGA